MAVHHRILWGRAGASRPRVKVFQRKRFTRRVCGREGHERQKEGRQDVSRQSEMKHEIYARSNTNGITTNCFRAPSSVAAVMVYILLTESFRTPPSSSALYAIMTPPSYTFSLPIMNKTHTIICCARMAGTEAWRK